MLLAVAVVLLVLAVAGGLAFHPLFLVAVLALLVFLGGRRSLA
jgi:hypothetical protein